mmetsp:Transcript_25676/g.64101  ORF Transcript_25676/g.64101 Transcript_25676/m.64101 type:complete len:367 (+) Transcript_25676:1352-2452(+)
MNLAAREFRNRRDRSDVHERDRRRRTENDVRTNLIPREFQGSVLVKVVLGIQKRALFFLGERCGCAIADGTVSDGWPGAHQKHAFPTGALEQKAHSLHRGSESARRHTGALGIGKGVHARQPVEQLLKRRSAFRQRGDQVLGTRQKHFLDIGNDDNRRLGVLPRRKRVKVHRRIIRDQPHLRPPVVRQHIQRVPNRLHHIIQRPRRDRVAGHLQHKNIRRRHRRADHVLRRRDELDGPPAELRALGAVAAAALVVERGEIVRGGVVEEEADGAAPAAAAVAEHAHEVDVAPAAPAADDACRAEVYHGDGLAGFGGGKGRDQNAEGQRVAPGHGRTRRKHFCAELNILWRCRDKRLESACVRHHHPR